jgi:hypothetical protein
LSKGNFPVTAAFHDLVTLMESLTGSYSACKDVLAEWYQSTKVGILKPEARYEASFMLTPKHFLPAVKSFHEWNSFNKLKSADSIKTSKIPSLGSQIKRLECWLKTCTMVLKYLWLSCVVGWTHCIKN